MTELSHVKRRRIQQNKGGKKENKCNLGRKKESRRKNMKYV